MKISIALQTVVFLKAILLGVALSVIYDVFRAVRRTARAGIGLTAVFDGAFWLVVLASLYVFVLTAADGEGRFYILLGGGFGMVLYFLTCSPPILSLFCFVARGCAKAAQIPCKLLEKTRAAAMRVKNRDKSHKKIGQTLKKHFHFGQK